MSFNQNNKHSFGDIITYGTTDSLAFGGVSLTLVYLISIPISSIIGLTYLFFLFGYSLFPGVAVFVLMMVINYFYVKKNLHFQSNYLKFKGQRIRLIEEILNNIKFIKSNVLEFFFIEKLEVIRKIELKWIKKLAYRIVYVVFNSWASSALMTVFMFFFFILFGNQLTVPILFTSLLIMRTYQSDLTFLPNIVGSLIDFMVSSERITDFLLTDELLKLKNDFDG